jgi:hypothetical protein
MRPGPVGDGGASLFDIRGNPRQLAPVKARPTAPRGLPKTVPTVTVSAYFEASSNSTVTVQLSDFLGRNHRGIGPRFPVMRLCSTRMPRWSMTQIAASRSASSGVEPLKDFSPTIRGGLMGANHSRPSEGRSCRPQSSSRDHARSMESGRRALTHSRPCWQCEGTNPCVRCRPPCLGSDQNARSA